MRILIDEVSLNRSEWLSYRAKPELYTASQVATIMGFGFQSPYELWLAKTGRVGPETSANARQLDYGLHMEQLLTRWLIEDTGKTFAPVDQLWQSEEYPFLICTPDIISRDGTIAELKTSANVRQRKTWEEGIPEAAEIQLLMNLAVGGAPKGIAAGLVAGNATSFKWHERAADPEFFAYAIDRVEEFRKHVKNDTPPEDFMTAADWSPVTKHFDMGANLRSARESDRELVALYKRLSAEKSALDKVCREKGKEVAALKARVLATCDGYCGIDLGDSRLEVKKIEKNMKARDAYVQTEYRINISEEN